MPNGNVAFLIRILLRIRHTLIEKIANFIDILQNNYVFTKESRTFKKISVARKIHIFRQIFRQIVTKFSDFWQNINIFVKKNKNAHLKNIIH